MSLADNELPDGLDPEHTLIHSVYCDNCGFNLRYATYVGRCNECGQSYNARPLFMKGIFTPRSLEFPTGDILLTLMCAVISALTFLGAVNPIVTWAVVLALVFGVAAVVFGIFAVRRLSGFLRALRIQQRIRAEEE